MTNLFKIIVMLVVCIANSVYAQTHSFDTTFTTNKNTFHIELTRVDTNRFLLTATYDLKTVLQDTIHSHKLSKPEFTDFNDDGNPDIMVFCVRNVFELHQFIYLYDPTTNNFRKVSGFDNYSRVRQLKLKPRYFFSYEGNGCADMKWVSDLFTIDNFRTIQIGHIEADGCVFELPEKPELVEIYKVADQNTDKRVLIKTIPYLKLIPNDFDKRDFIEKYWTKNLKHFE